MRVNVKIKRLNEDAVIPQYAHEGDVCFDLVAVEDVIIEPGQTVKIPTGLAMQQPPGYAIEIRPRSGISEKTKLRISNSPGTIDQYTGEICVLIDNIAPIEYDIERIEKRHNLFIPYDYRVLQIGEGVYETDGSYPINTYIIRKGDRIAQALVVQIEQALFTEVDTLSETSRGSGGFGSSGVKS